MEKHNHFFTGLTFLAAGAAVAYSQFPEIVNTNLPTIQDKAIFVASFALSTSLPDIDQKIRGIEHRTITHSLLFCVPFIYLGTIYKPLFGVACAILHHLVIDAMSNQGVPWFWPLQGFIRYEGGKRVVSGHHFRFYRSRSVSETVWAVIICLLNVALFVYMLQYIDLKSILG